MPLVNFKQKDITFKVVYYGTGLGGKTRSAADVVRVAGGVHHPFDRETPPLSQI